MPGVGGSDRLLVGVWELVDRRLLAHFVALGYAEQAGAAACVGAFMEGVLCALLQASTSLRAAVGSSPAEAATELEAQCLVLVTALGKHLLGVDGLCRSVERQLQGQGQGQTRSSIANLEEKLLAARLLLCLQLGDCCAPSLLRAARTEFARRLASSTNSGSSAPAGDASTAQSFSVTGLTNSATYWVAIQATDTAGNEGPISDVLTASPEQTCGLAECYGDTGCSCSSSGSSPRLGLWLLLLGATIAGRRRS